MVCLHERIDAPPSDKEILDQKQSHVRIQTIKTKREPSIKYPQGQVGDAAGPFSFFNMIKDNCFGLFGQGGSGAGEQRTTASGAGATTGKQEERKV